MAGRSLLMVVLDVESQQVGHRSGDSDREKGALLRIADTRLDRSRAGAEAILMCGSDGWWVSVVPSGLKQ